MGRLVLNSKGFNTKIGCRQIREVLQDENLAEKTMFLVSFPEYEVDELIIDNCVNLLGFKRENLFLSADGIPEGITPDFVYVTEGNTFEVLQYMRDHLLTEYIKELMKNGKTTYIGSSAGAAIAGSDIMLARDFDSNYVRMFDFTGLALFEGAIVPHFTAEQLERYLGDLEEHIKNRYEKIYSVSNEEVLVM